MNIDSNDLVKLAKYFKPISHTKGRLRVRVSPKIKELADEINLEEVDKSINKIQGIKNVKFNKIIGSVTIEYDNEIFQKELWDNLINGENLDFLSEKINNIKKDLYAK